VRGTAATDTFTRTLATGWGTATTGQVWSTDGAGGTVAAADWSVNGTQGLMSVPVANAYRFAYLGTFSQPYVDLAVDASIAVIPTGGPIEMCNLLARGTSNTSYYLYRVQVETSASVTVIIYAPGGAQLGSITVPGLTYTANLKLRVRVQAVGKVFRAKVWQAAAAEPANYVLTVTDATYTGAGWAGVRCGVSAANTNALPIVFTYDNFSSVLLPDFPRDNVPLTVLAAFGADLSKDPSTWTWTNITTDVRHQSVVITPGRADETSQAASASCTFQLLNDSMAYSANNPMSPNWPNVKRNTPIWVMVDPATRFFGYANGFVPSWDPSGKMAVVSVSSNGTLRRLTQGKSPLRSPHRRAMDRVMPRPLAYYALEEGPTATQGYSGLPGGPPMSVVGAHGFGGGVGLTGSPNIFRVHVGSGLYAAVTGVGTTSWRVEWVARFKSGKAGSFGVFMIQLVTSGTVNLLQVVSDPTDWYVLPKGSTYTAGGKFSGHPVYDGLLHHYRLDLAQVGADFTINGYCDGVLEINATVPGQTMGSITQVEVGLNSTADTAQKSERDDLPDVGGVGVWDGNPTLSIDTASAALGWVNEPAVIRLARLCAEEGVPLAITGGADTVYEGFESASPAVAFSGTWGRDSTQFHSGAWSYKSAAITHSQATDATVNVPAGATSMSVWYKVSSESGFDFFRILRDGVQEFQASGEVGWTQRTISVVGVSQVTFRYIKDGNTSVGSDAAWIDDLTFVGPSSTRMGLQGMDTFVNLLRECEAADLGLLYDGFGPGLGYVTRSARYNLPASLTLDMAADPPQVNNPFNPADDDQRNRNLWKVDRKNGSSATAEDKTGPLGTAAIGTYDSQTTLNVATDNVLPGYASWLVHMGTTEGFRYPNLSIDLGSNPELIDNWISAKLNSHIDVLNVSSKAIGHTAGTVSLLDEGYTETITPKTYTVAANCSPYDPWRAFVINTDRVDGDGYKLAAGVNATATTLSVTSTTGLLWGTTADPASSFPFDIEVAGIRLRVTGISGTSSPQTFTVQRSMDGFDKPLPANSPVRLWRPAVIAL
jgi:hypothetical protein